VSLWSTERNESREERRGAKNRLEQHNGDKDRETHDYSQQFLEVPKNSNWARDQEGILLGVKKRGRKKKS